MGSDLLISEVLSTGMQKSVAGESVLDVLVPIMIDDEIDGVLKIGYSMDNVQAAVLQNTTIIFIISAIAFVLIGVFFFRMSNRVVVGVGQMKDDLAIMSEGNFTKEVNQKSLKSKDELSEMASAMQTLWLAIREIVKNVLDSAHELTESAETLSATAIQTSAASKEVGMTIEQIAKGAAEQPTYNTC
ncbi:methyl-accepting chemotaxis protein [Fusibacter tunisiensis]|uniref:Methyl-accepting chemotaxis protein n=1 Tax=Fusibacter tunisiensis TaxID=1008308 RepID=A0ABS2MTI1_9FIRM|nr:hypothetical protein [Fusibacter tunisiensis]MBM7562660.1 methyl-accepting chemotaxis protein [Fusibacter tunisiensis]